jgi:plastocyanin
MRRFLLLLAFGLIGAAPPASAPASADGLTVYVRGPGNVPIRDAVVTVHLVGRPTPPPAARGGSFTVDQRDIRFHPYVLMVPVGADVAFPNFDTVRHHVYSFSPARRFELKLYAREQARAVRFDTAGIVALGCNIHDQMSAFIAVVDTAFAVKTDASGNAMFPTLPPGPVRITVWHPLARAPGNAVTRAAAGTGAETVALTLRPAAAH